MCMRCRPLSIINGDFLSTYHSQRVSCQHFSFPLHRLSSKKNTVTPTSPVTSPSNLVHHSETGSNEFAVSKETENFPRTVRSCFWTLGSSLISPRGETERLALAGSGTRVTLNCAIIRRNTETLKFLIITNGHVD
jgi:hypothetical protein